MSYKVSLTTAQSYELADLLQEIQSKKLSRRLLAISLRHYGYKVKDISKIIGVSEKTITQWIKLFLAGGFEALLALHYPKRRDSRLAPYEEAIRTFRADHPQAKLEALQLWLKEVHQVEVEYSWLYRYIERWEL